MELDAAEGGVGVEVAAERGGAIAMESGISTESIESGLATAAVLVVASLTSRPCFFLSVRGSASGRHRRIRRKWGRGAGGV